MNNEFFIIDSEGYSLDFSFLIFCLIYFYIYLYFLFTLKF